MMYETLARFYDALVKDEEATKAWVSLIEDSIEGNNILELACGSGEITISLAKDGYKVMGTDLSSDMIEEAKKKADSNQVSWKVMDMSDFSLNQTFDAILCLCDSFNYLLHEEQVLSMIQCVKKHLTPTGTFIMDMHSLDRLYEFEEEYNEAGKIENHEYQWTIQTIDDSIYQNFAFYDEEGRVTLEQHIQRVYDPIWVKEELEKAGFAVTIKTDFDQDGICEGEKIFYICKRQGEEV